jgi:hypothetical protein
MTHVKEVKMAIDPSAGFGRLVNAWNAAHKAGLLNKGQGYWHAGNTLDTYVDYLVAAKQGDAAGIVGLSYPLFTTNLGTPEAPGWWRDDYGWWGIAFLNASRPDHASILGLSDAVVRQCFNAADVCWQIMNYNWEKGGHTGVRNDPAPGNGVANTITNVLFLMLSLRRYHIKKDVQALETAKSVFDWFSNRQGTQPDIKRLLNSDNLIRETPGSPDDRAWTGDQGWFWRACLALRLVDHDPGRVAAIMRITDLIGAAVYKKVFVNGVVRELPYAQNYDVDYATGPGVFIRQFSIINQDQGGFKDNYDKIRQSAQGAWDYSESGCWYPDNCKYPGPTDLLWDLTLKTSSQDAYNAYMSVPN